MKPSPKTPPSVIAAYTPVESATAKVRVPVVVRSRVGLEPSVPTRHWAVALPNYRLLPEPVKTAPLTSAELNTVAGVPPAIGTL